MKREDQVVSLELAKRLKELGVKQSSWFYWVRLKAWERHRNSPEFTLQYIHWFDELEEQVGLDCFEIYAAFTVAELGLLLPECIPNEGDMMIWRTSKNEFGIEYCGSSFPHFVELNEANSRAKMLIWLIENGHVKNERQA